MAANANLKLLRSIMHELRLSSHTHSKRRDSAIMQYVINLYRQNTVTDLQYCREKDELAFMAQTYATYLKSRRRLKDIHEEYHGKGERSIEETASIVGFKLPHNPR